MRTMPSLILWMLDRNLPLPHWPNYVEAFKKAQDAPPEDEAARYFKWSAPSQKELENAGRKIVSSLSQRAVADRVVIEWEDLPSFLRQAITRICNDYGWTISHNVSKGITYLNKRLHGKILARVRGPEDAAGEEVDLARAGAERAFAGFVRPPNFNKLSPREKRLINQQLAAERRVERRALDHALRKRWERTK